MNHLDLFTGIGGFSLAAQEVWQHEHSIISFCEIDKRCREFLSRSWPGVPCHDDIKTLDATRWLGTVDLLTGGPPCQPVSCAGKRKGAEDDRFLWPEAIRIISECKPTWVLCENPHGLISMGLDGILTEMESIGYEVGVLDIPACAVNSPQRRHRLWILAHSSRNNFKHDTKPCSRRASVKRRGEPDGCGCLQTGINTEHGHLADTEVSGIGTGLRDPEPGEQWRVQPANGCWDSYVWLPCADGKVRRAPDDSIELVDGLHPSLLGALGNSIVPQVAAQIMQAIKEAGLESCPHGRNLRSCSMESSRFRRV